MNILSNPASVRPVFPFVRSTRVGVALLAGLLMTGMANGQTSYTWNDPNSNSKWTSKNNWLPTSSAQNVGPTGTDIVVFGTTPYGNTGINVDASSFALAVQIATGSTFTMSPNGATTLSIVSGSLTRSTASSGTQTFSVPIVLGSNAATVLSSTWTIDGAGTFVVSGAISGANAGTSLTKTGTGVLELSGANTFGGALTLNSGTLRIATINNGGVAGVTGTSSNVATNFVLGGGVLEYTGATGSTDRSFTLTNATTSTINVTTAATNLTFTGSSAATTGALTKIGAGTLTLAGASNYSGATTVNAGTLALGTNNTLPNASAVTVNAASLNVGLFSDSIASLTTTGNTTLAFSGSAATAGSLTLGSLSLGAGTDALNVTFSTAPSAVRYNLISYTSRSGTFDSATLTGVSGYRLVYGSTGSGTIALAQVANQTFTPTAGISRALVSSTFTVTGTLANTSASAANAPLDVSLSGTSQNPFLGFTPAQGSTVAGASSSLVTGTLTALATAGTQNWSMVNSDSLATTTTATASGTTQVVNQRSFSATAGSVNLGRYLITASLPTGTTGVTSSGLNAVTATGSLGAFSSSNGLTLSLTSGSANFAGAASSQTAGYSVSGSATSAGSLSGSFSSAVTAEFGSISPVVVNYTANPVNQRSFSATAGSVDLGRYLITASLPTGTTGVTSSGLNAVTATGSLGAFSSSNGLTLSLTSGSANFAGAAASQTAGYSVSGSATSAGSLAGSFSSTVAAEFGSITPVVVNYTANPVNQRSFSATAGTVDLGRFLINGSLPTGTTGVASSGLNSTTASGTLGGFSASNGLTLTLNSGTNAFLGAAASQTAGYAISGSAASVGSLSGSFASTVSAEFGSISPVVVNYTANPVNQRTFSTSTSALNLGFVHQGDSFASATITVTSTGLNATTASGTIGAFGGGPAGLSMSRTSGAAQFTGTGATQSTIYTLSGSTGLGSFSGTFTSAVAAELGSIPSLTLAVSGQVYSGSSTWATNGGGNWGTLSSGFGTNWQANQGSPGLDASFANTDTATFGSVLTSGSAAIYLNGANPSLKSLTFNNANSYAIYASAGGSSITLSAPTAALVTTLSGTHAVHSELTLASNATFNVASNARFEMHGVLSGSGSLTKTGAGVLGFYGDNDFVGSTSINDGTVFIEAGTNPFGAASNSVTVGGTALLNLNGRNVPNTITISGSGASVINAFAGYTATISGTGVITSGTGSEITGNYSVTSTGSAAFQGPMGGYASIAGGGQATFQNQISGSGNVAVSASGIALFSGTQGGIVNTSGSSTFNGVVTETVAVNAGYAGFNAATGTGSTINVNSGLAAYSASVGGVAHVTSASGTATFAGPIAATASVEFTNGGVGRLLEGSSLPAVTILNNGMLYVERSTNLVAPAAITGTGSVTKLFSGTFAMTGASTYSGPTTISAGAFQIGNGGTTGSLSPSSPVSIAGGAALVFNRSDAISQGTHFSSAAIDGSGGVTQAGSGVVTLTAINTYTGVTAITSGTISAAEVFSSQNGSNIGKAPNSAVQLSNQGTLLYTGTTNAYSRGFALGNGGGKLLVASAGVTLEVNTRDITGSGTFTVGGAGNTTINAVLKHTGGLRYVGTGTLTLNGNNTYTGMTNIDSGKAVVADTNGSGELASSVTIAPGALLSGVGLVSGTLSGGGTVSPGNSPGILEAVAFDPAGGLGSAFEFQIKNAEPTYNNRLNSQNDVLHLTGTSGSSFLSPMYAANVVDVYMSLDAIPTQAGDYLEGGFFADGMDAATLYNYVKDATYVGWVATNGLGERTFNGVNYVPLTSLGGYTGLQVTTKYYANQNFQGGSVSGSVTEFIVVPEPGSLTLAAAGIGVGLAAYRLRRRSRRSRGA